MRLRAYRLYRARNDLLQQLEREPRDVELAQAAGLTVDAVRELSRYLQPVLSLDAPVGEDEDNELVDVVPDPVAELQLSEAMRSTLTEELERLLQHLTAEEKEVVILRFGLLGQPLHSRQEAGKRLGMTSERVQRLEARALRKLRDPDLLRRLEVAMDV